MRLAKHGDQFTMAALCKFDWRIASVFIDDYPIGICSNVGPDAFANQVTGEQPFEQRSVIAEAELDSQVSRGDGSGHCSISRARSGRAADAMYVVQGPLPLSCSSLWLSLSSLCDLPEL